MTRIDWAPDGNGLVTCQHGAVRLHDAAGKVLRELAGARVLDVRWLDDGRILAVDNRGTLTWHPGVLVDQSSITFLRLLSTGCLARRGSHFAAVSGDELFVARVTGERVWTFNHRVERVATDGTRTVILSSSCELVAITYDRRDYLSPDERGPPAVEVLDTLRIDPDLADVLAIAFDRDSRRIACLASDGSIDVVPVP